MRPCGLVFLTSSIDVVPSVESVNGMPAAPAAPAPAVSPSVCMSRVKPVGAMPKGMAELPPMIWVEVSTFVTSLRIEGWNSISRKDWTERSIEISPSAAPSV